MTENLEENLAETIAYMDILLPTVAMCLKKLQELNAINIGHVQLSPPLIRALTSGIKTRFQQCFDNLDFPLSSAPQSHF